MLELTPLDKTVAGQELIRMGIKTGMEKGELIGQIRMEQRFFKCTLTPKNLWCRLIKSLK